MSRPREYGKRVSTAIRIDKGLHKRLRIEAAYRDVSLNRLVQSAVEQWLKRNEGKAKL